MFKPTVSEPSIDSAAWDVFARHQAFFHILSDPSMIDPDASQQAEFWSSGERDLKALAEFGGLQPVSGTGVDFGCGLGRLTRALRAFTAQQTGLDISAEMLSRARDANREFPTMTFLQIQDGRWPMADRSCDLVISQLVFQHLSSVDLMETALTEMARILKKDGKAVFHIVTTTVLGSFARSVKDRFRASGTATEDARIARVKEKLESAAGGTQLQFSEEEIELMFLLDCRRMKSMPLRRLKRILRRTGLDIDRMSREPGGSTTVAVVKSR
jgi:SAM-dependent methyltransferase